MNDFSAFRAPLKSLFALLAMGLAASPAYAVNQLIFAQQNTGTIYQINQLSGVSTQVATESGHFWNGAAFNSQTGLVYISDVGTNNPLGGTSNTLYSFNPAAPAAPIIQVGTVTGQNSFYDAGFYNNKYYTVPVGSNKLLSLTLPSSGTAALTPTQQTLGGLGTNVTGLLLGDIDFIGSSVYIYGTQIINGNSAGSNVLYKYADVSNLTSPTYTKVLSGTGAGLVYDPGLGKLIITNTDNSIYSVDPTTGTATSIGTITGPDTGGNGDFALIVAVPEPSAIWEGSIMLSLAAFAWMFRRMRAVPQG